jgi:hypothetical protein
MKTKTFESFNERSEIAHRNDDFIEEEPETMDFSEEDSDTERLTINDVNKKTLTVKIKDFEKHIFDKAVNIKSKKRNSLLRFNSLQDEIW